MTSRVVGAWVLAVLLAGCGKRAGESGQARTASQKPRVEDVFAKVDGLLQAGDTNAALEAVAAALKDEDYSAQRSDLFHYQLSLLLSAARVNEAREKFMAVTGSDEALARGGFGLVGRYYTSRGDTNALNAWVEGLTQAALPDDLARTAFGWHLRNRIAAGDLDAVLALAPKGVERFGMEAGGRLLLNAESALLAAKDYAGATRLLDALDALAGDNAPLRGLAAGARVNLLARQEQWADAERLMLSIADSLDDATLRNTLAGLLSRAAKARQDDVVDRVCVHVLDHESGKTAAVKDAARRWVESASGKDPVEALLRLATTMEKHLSPSDGLILYSRYFYVLMEQALEKREDLVALGRALEAELTEPAQKERLKALLFDGSFLMNDYETALTMLEQGLPNRDEQWHEMAINKLKAHLALAEGNTDEAIQRFRTFMEHVKGSWTESERDPSTGLLHTREMALGFNARRIGDILVAAGKEDAARDSYTEARTYYLDAASKLKPDSPEYAAVDEALKAIPKPLEDGSTAP